MQYGLDKSIWARYLIWLGVAKKELEYKEIELEVPFRHTIKVLGDSQDDVPIALQQWVLAYQEDDGEIVRGHEGFDKHAGSLGFNEDQWEGEWDENITEAEAYFDAKEVARLAVEEAATSVEVEADDSVTSTDLSEAMDEMPRHDLDSFLGDVESRRHLSDAEVELTASDASYREEIFELTGEEGVLPGEQVNVDAMVDNTVVGNEVRSASSDFTLPDEPDSVTKIEPESESSEEDTTSKRRGIRRRKKEE